MIADVYRKYAAELGLEERRAVEAALEELDKAGAVILRAPTGYGKSLFSIPLGLAAYEELWRGGIAKVIHVAPMSSIVEDLYRRALRLLTRGAEDASLEELEGLLVEKYGRRWVGFQSWAIDADFKDPLYLWSSLIYTAFDSFVLNLFKITPLRAERAPYESARAAIMRSVVVLDEAHLMADPSGGRQLAVFVAVVKSLRRLGVPTVVATATISDASARLIKNAVGGEVKVVASTVEGCEKGGDVLVHDYKVENRVDARLAKIPMERLREELKSRSFSKALLMFNTVKRAVNAYRQLRGEFDAVLLHGRLTLGDRAEAVKKARKAKVVVATQVVEAGVDLDSDLLITDIAPVPSLIQRIGRVARKDIKHGEALINIHEEAVKASRDVYGEGETEAAQKALRKFADAGGRLEVDWRNPCPEGNTYAALLEEFDKEAYPDPARRYDAELSLALQALNDLPTLHRRDAERLLRRYCGFAKDAAAVPLADPACYEEAKSKPEEAKRCILLVSSDFLDRIKGRIVSDGALSVIVEVPQRGKEGRAGGTALKVLRAPASILFDAEGRVDCRKALALDYYMARLIGARAVVLGILVEGYARGEGLIADDDTSGGE